MSEIEPSIAGENSRNQNDATAIDQIDSTNSRNDKDVAEVPTPTPGPGGKAVAAWPRPSAQPVFQRPKNAVGPHSDWKDFLNEADQKIVHTFCKAVAEKTAVCDVSELDFYQLIKSIGLNTKIMTKEEDLLSILLVLLLRQIQKDYVINFKYPTLKDFNDAYDHMFEKEDELEQITLWHSANWMNVLFGLITAKKNKGLTMQVIPRLIEGWHVKYVTGSGQTHPTANRVRIFEREGNCMPNTRVKVKKPKVLLEGAELEAAVSSVGGSLKKNGELGDGVGGNGLLPPDWMALATAKKISKAQIMRQKKMETVVELRAAATVQIGDDDTGPLVHVEPPAGVGSGGRGGVRGPQGSNVNSKSQTKKSNLIGNGLFNGSNPFSLRMGSGDPVTVALHAQSEVGSSDPVPLLLQEMATSVGPVPDFKKPDMPSIAEASKGDKEGARIVSSHAVVDGNEQKDEAGGPGVSPGPTLTGENGDRAAGTGPVKPVSKKRMARASNSSILATIGADPTALDDATILLGLRNFVSAAAVARAREDRNVEKRQRLDEAQVQNDAVQAPIGASAASGSAIEHVGSNQATSNISTSAISRSDMATNTDLHIPFHLNIDFQKIIQAHMETSVEAKSATATES